MMWYYLNVHFQGQRVKLTGPYLTRLKNRGFIYTCKICNLQAQTQLKSVTGLHTTPYIHVDTLSDKCSSVSTVLEYVLQINFHLT
jgi:hypothetical protein